MRTRTTKVKLIDNVFKLVKGIDENKVLQEVQETLGVTKKQTITRRIKYSPIEQDAITNIFKKYGVEENIWITPE